MLTRPVTSEALARLRDERDLADRQYNDALTALDQSLAASAPLPDAPRVYDDHQVGTLNERWAILSDVSLPAPRGIRSRLAHFVWRLVAPIFERQQAFNSVLVDHLNRNVAAGRDARVVESSLLSTQSAAITAFQAHLIQYLQQVTLYVDSQGPSRGRRSHGGIRRRHQYAHRRLDAARRIDGGARGAHRRSRHCRRRGARRPARPTGDDAAGDADAEA